MQITKKELFIFLIGISILLNPIFVTSNNHITGLVTYPIGGCGDFNNDGSASLGDLVYYQQNMNIDSANANFKPLADYNDNNKIDYIDLGCFKKYDFGKTLSCPLNSKFCSVNNMIYGGCSDFNYDGTVASGDLVTLQQNIGRAPTNSLFDPRTDYNDDNRTDDTDLRCFNLDFGSSLNCPNKTKQCGIGGCGDFNYDGSVSLGDLTYIQQRLNIDSSNANFNALADYNDDNKINSIDLGCFKLKFGQTMQCPLNSQICSLFDLSFGGCGDFNYDGQVTLGDLTFIQQRLNTNSNSVNYDPRADYNDDGRIDSIDVNCFNQDFGNGLNCPNQARQCGINGGCGDFNNDGSASLGDLVYYQQNMNIDSANANFKPLADYNDNNKIDYIDLGCFKKYDFGQSLSCPQNSKYCGVINLSKGGCADFDYDGSVSLGDLTFLQQRLNMNSNNILFDPRADFDDDGIINTQDLNCFQNSFGQNLNCPQAASSCSTTQTAEKGCSDFNFNGQVDSQDLVLFQQSYLKPTSDPNFKASADYDDDGDVDYIDLKCFQEDFGKSNFMCPGDEKSCGCLQGCADFDRDGVVSNSDLIALQQISNTCTGNPLFNPKLDFNNDGCINITQTSFDFLCFQERFGDSLTCNFQPPTLSGGCSDFNNDGQVTLGDLTFIQQISTGSKPYDPYADYNDDNLVDEIDIACFNLDFNAGLPISCPTNSKKCGCDSGCADLNRDGNVTLADITILSSINGFCSTDPRYRQDADFDRNNCINAEEGKLDLVCVQNQFGKSITCGISPPAPYQIILTANPPTIPADGISTSNITITLKDNVNRVVPGKSIVFSLTSGQGTFTTPTSDTTDNQGTADVTIRSISSQTDIATTIKAQYLGYPPSSSQVTIQFTGVSSPGGPSGPSGGGGGRCRPDWDCTEWTSCGVQGSKLRVCSDLENCRTTRDKPSTSQSCTYIPPRGDVCESSWSCTEWNDCDNGVQTRNCIDLNSCQPEQTETQDCYGNCNDGIKNFEEVDVDCGGSCKPCGRYSTTDIAKDLALPILGVLAVLLIISYFLRKKTEHS